jgi:hypothetical protein
MWGKDSGRRACKGFYRCVLTTQRHVLSRALLRARGRGRAMRRTLWTLNLGHNDESDALVRACMLFKILDAIVQWRRKDADIE